MRTLLLSLSFLATTPAVAADVWWNTAWEQRIKLTIDNGTIGEDLHDFPVLVKLDSNWVDYSDIASNGNDLRFTDATGTPLSYDVDEWNEGGESFVWVRIPVIAQARNDEYFYMYFDQPGALGEANSADVWGPAQYRLVQHFNPSLQDASPEANGFSPGGPGPQPTYPYPAYLGDGAEFTWGGAPDVFLSDRSVIQWAEQATTFTWWMQGYNGDDNQCNKSPMLWGNTTGGGDQIYIGCLRNDGTIGMGQRYDEIFSNTRVNTGQWRFVAMTRDNNGRMRVYVDGDLENELSSYPGHVGYGPGTRWGQPYGPDSNGDLGVIDELHLVDVERSPQWIRAQYLSQSDQYISRCNPPYAPAFFDADQDGFGDGSAPALTQCAEVQGMVDNGDDCDDADGAINPNEIELCDGLNDEDCDGLVDGDDPDIPNLDWYEDDDGDGFGESGTLQQQCDNPGAYVQNDQSDCDDSNDQVNPSAQEICNTIDDDCDGAIDTDDSSVDPTQLGTFYRDGDGDNWGDDSDTLESCEAPVGYVINGGDCNDLDDTVGGPDDWYADADGDGYGNVTSHTAACSQPAGYVADNTDCSDADPDEHPGARWYRDSDGDTFGDTLDSKVQCPTPTGYVAILGDCDDGDEALNPTTVWYPDTDSDGFGVDTSTLVQCVQPTAHSLVAGDCDDGDAALNPHTTWWHDGDGDSFGDSADSVQQCAQPSSYVDNNFDCDDGDANIVPTDWWYADFDGDTYGDPNAAQQSCTPPPGHVEDNTDCDDGDRNLHPATVWNEDNDGDGFGNPLAEYATPQCEQPAGHANDNTDCDDTEATINPDTVWYLDYDGDGFGDPDIAVQQCDPISGYVSNGWDCDDGNATVVPDTLWYFDSDGDGFGDDATAVAACDYVPGHTTSGGDCDDEDPYVYPAAIDSCGDGVDADCDGSGGPDDDEDGDTLSWTSEWGFSDPCDDDTDGDSVNDGLEFGLDTDGDGVSDITDDDDDGDGVPTSAEAGRDTDSDGIDDNLDDDDDGDGVLSIDEDLDGDGNPVNDDGNDNGVPAFLDFTEPFSPELDTDGDGILDYVEDQIGSDPTLADSDGDGVSDSDEVGDTEAPTDTDGDGVPDIIDDDDDGDGIPTAEEGSEDIDGDGLGNHLDLDSDGDGVADAAEATTDSDGDGILDAFDNHHDTVVEAPEQADYGLGCRTVPGAPSGLPLLLALFALPRRRR